MLEMSPISLSAHTVALEVTFVVAAPLLNLTLLSAAMVRIKRMFCVHFNLRTFHFLGNKILNCLINIPLLPIVFLEKLIISIFGKMYCPTHFQ